MPIKGMLLAGGSVEMVEYLPSKLKALSSNPSTMKNKQTTNKGMIQQEDITILNIYICPEHWYPKLIKQTLLGIK
jgi:hypothetical protein